MPARQVRRRPGARRPLVRSGQAGAVLPAMVILTVAILILILTTFHVGALDASLVAQGVSRSQALYIAEGGLSKGQSWLEAYGDPPAVSDTLFPFGEDVGTFADGRELVWIVPDGAGGPGGYFTIVSEATVRGRTRRLETDVRAGIFSDFLYFTDTEHMPGSGNPLWFCTGDVIEGPMFTNDQISIFGDPRFTSMASSAYGGPQDSNINHNAAIYYYNNSATNHIESTQSTNAPYDEPDFAEGVQLGAEHIIYPRLPSVFEFRADARDGGIDLAGAYEVVLGRDPGTGVPMLGYVSYRKSTTGWTDVLLSSINGIMFVNGTVSVQGVLDGRLTIVTNGNITVTNDITYLASNEDGPLEGCDDMLGLLSGADIVVENNAPNCDDCVIHAAMMSLCNSFYANSWNTGSPRGNLTVWGSIVQSFRGNVGTGALINGQPVVITGYAKDYHYDWRLQVECPPGFYRFLKTGNYKRLAWREIPQDELGYTPTAI